MKIFEEVFAECAANPIDLLGIGDSPGESAYLTNARHSYERTLRAVVALLEGQLETGTPVRVLEVGAYLGAVSVTLARLGCRVLALDLPEFMANPRLCKRFADNRVRTVAVNLRDYPLPLEDAAFDLVIMCETLEHLNFNPLPVLTELNRVLADGGHLYLALPNLASLQHRVQLFLGHSIHNPVVDFREQLSQQANMIVGIHWREYTRAELFEMLGLCGFSCQRHAYLNAVRASAPAWVIYQVFPALRPFQAVLARKSGPAPTGFHFCGATIP
jgi:SAM-dependent methyltransferase